jgi:hypothetical protein
LSAHGQGTTPTVVPGYLVAYMLHMTERGGTGQVIHHQSFQLNLEV